jgi:hypothetical protein
VTLTQRMYLWLRWKLGHKEFKPYGRSNPSVRPNVGFGGKGQPAVPKTWWAKLATMWWNRNPYPLTVDPAAFWRSIGYWTAWGWGNGQFVDSAKVRAGTVTAADLKPTLLKLKARGAKWVGVMDTVETRSMMIPMKQALAELGLGLVVWDRYYTPDGAFFKADAAVDYWKPDAFSANIEDRGDWRQLANGLRLAFPALPLSVWTTFEGAGVNEVGAYDLSLSAPWRLNGWTCIPEAYVNSNPQATPDNLDWVARAKLAFTEVVTSIGVYDGWTVEMYADLLRNHPHYSVYLAEYLPELP